MRNHLAVTEEDRELVEDGPSGTSVAARAFQHELDSDKEKAKLAGRLRRYIDYPLLLALKHIPNLNEVRLVGMVGRKEVELVRSRLPRICINSPYLKFQMKMT
ncbi:MAG: hypothetical protein H0X51_01310 [Parachlamydiaceae bacterium]|nr:hypothetical protein [Parachlamydiaceae bacterium]